MLRSSRKSQGLGLVRELVLRDNTIVFAGARKPTEATQLHELEKKFPGKVHVVELISADQKGNTALVKTVREIAGRLDVVIANAGALCTITSYVPS